MKVSLRIAVFAVFVFMTLSAGCSDPYSAHRIQVREAHIKQFADDTSKSERQHAERIREADETLKKWWRSDSERFRQRMPTIGDYVW